MAEYNIHFVDSAAKEFRSLSIDMKRRVGGVVETLRGNPYLVGARKLHGHGHFYRVRVGQYRIVYQINDQAKEVRVTRIRHRREAYR